MRGISFAATHALFRSEVERKLSNLMAHFAGVGSSSDRPGSWGLFDTVPQRPQYLDRVGPDRPHDPQEFDDVDPALATFVFGHERLGLFQAFGEVMLGEAGTLAGSDHQLAKGCLLGGMDGFADVARAGGHRRGRVIRSPDYPKRG